MCNRYFVTQTKLSKLQREILSMLYATNEELEPITPEMCKSGELKPWDRTEMLRAIFGLPNKQSWKKESPGLNENIANQIDRQAIGYETFNRANASFSRSLRRLGDRGLITYKRELDYGRLGWCNISLEYAGVEIARQIKQSSDM
jgi:hypothetical protein